jgi:AraC family transcriptional regulator
VKRDTEDDYFEAFYRVIAYIETGYREKITLQDISEVAKFSKFYFHRVFKAISGETIYDYIQRVRLQKSTEKLHNMGITEVAVTSGYETNSSFGKAFKRYFGVSPKEFKKSIIERIEISSIQPMRRESLEPIDVLYVRREGESYSEVASESWSTLMGFAYGQKIKHKKGLMGKDAMMFGIGHDNPDFHSLMRYDACISWDDKSVQSVGEISSKTVAGGDYALFLHRGSYSSLPETYKAIGNWIVQNSIQSGDRPIFEKYLNRDPRRTKPENLKTEIYVPVGESD